MGKLSKICIASALQLCMVVTICVTAAATIATSVQIDHVLKGRAFGSRNSTDISKKIAFGPDGAIYIAGTTNPQDIEQDPWGDTEAGDKTGKTDVFIAKVTPRGDLLWVRRTGSKEDDSLGDLKVFGDALYICGSTGGDIGHRINGSSDAFVVKMTLNGDLAWRRPFQFGSAGEDVCNALVVNKAVYVAGSTSGILFGDSKPVAGSVHHYIARLDEDRDSPAGLKLVKGRQRNAYSSSSANALGMSLDKVYFLSVNWDVSVGSKERVTTYINIVDEETVLLHRLQVLTTNEVGSFRGIDMHVVNETGEAYVVGISSFGNNSETYYAMKFNPHLQNSSTGIEWSTFLGHVSMDVPLDLQQPSIVADQSRNRVYVAGTEEGVFDDGDIYSGVVLIPFFKLDMETGVVVEKWDRTTDLAEGREEILDISLNSEGDVFFTGVTSTEMDSLPNAWVGSFGSSALLSNSANVDSFATSTDLKMEARTMARQFNDESYKGWILWACGISIITLLLGLMFFIRRKRQESRPGLVQGDNVWNTRPSWKSMPSGRQVYEVTAEQKSWKGGGGRIGI